jgi:hypothetical protein
MIAGRPALLFGTDEPPSPMRLLRAGDLTAELVGGNLAKIRWGGIEVLRGIAYLVRDGNWGNCPAEIEGLAVEETAQGFSLSYRAVFHAPEGAELVAEARIEGSATGSLFFDVVATAGTDFSTNRCGFCVLHPIVGLAGAPVIIEHVDGSLADAVLPELIAPAQPFKEIRAITHTVAPGVTATCRMEGDAFEMEDQRAWTDASYKTYVRPLALPWPYMLPAGVPQHQRVTLSIEGRLKAAAVSQPGPTAVTITLGGAAGVVPDFGLGIAPEDIAATLAAIDRLRAVHPQRLVLHFDPRAGHGREALAGFAAILAACPARATLECVVPCAGDPAAELRAIAALVAEAGLALADVMVSPAPDLKSTPPGSRWPDCPPLEEVYAAARAAFPGLPIGGGMISSFTELNRKRPPAHLLDAVSHTTAAIVHAADDRSVMETLQSLPFITRSVRAIIGGARYRIGPAAIGMRDNPYGARLNPNPSGGRITMTDADPRQRGLFAAAWMIGYAAAVADAGLDALTLGALAGPFGLVEPDGRLRPAFHAARALARLAGQAARPATSSEPSAVLAVCGGDTVLVANLTGERQRCRVPGLVALERLDEAALSPLFRGDPLPVELGKRDRFELGAYGITVATVGDAG